MINLIEYKRVLAGFGISLLITGLAACDRGVDPDMSASDTESTTAYNAGYEFGIRLALFQQQQPGTGADEALKGLLDALTDTNHTISSNEICASLQPVQDKQADSVEVPEIETGIEKARDHNTELDASYEKVVALGSGVQYQVLTAGSGVQPRAGDEVVISYRTYLDDGTLFGSTGTDDDARQISLNEIKVPGLKEALLLMNEGARWRVVIPPNMGFTKSGNRTLRRSNLTYDIELVSVEQGQP